MTDVFEIISADWSNTQFSFADNLEIETIFNYLSITGAAAVHIPRSAEKRSGDVFHVVQSNFLFFPLRSSKIKADKSGQCLEAQEDKRTSICLAELAADVLELDNGSRGTDRLLVDTEEEEEEEKEFEQRGKGAKKEEKEEAGREEQEEEEENDEDKRERGGG